MNAIGLTVLLASDLPGPLGAGDMLILCALAVAFVWGRRVVVWVKGRPQHHTIGHDLIGTAAVAVGFAAWAAIFAVSRTELHLAWKIAASLALAPFAMCAVFGGIYLTKS